MGDVREVQGQFETKWPFGFFFEPLNKTNTTHLPDLFFLILLPFVLTNEAPANTLNCWGTCPSAPRGSAGSQGMCTLNFDRYCPIPLPKRSTSVQCKPEVLRKPTFPHAYIGFLNMYVYLCACVCV